MQIFQEFILSQWLILIALTISFIVISRWAIVVLKEYPGYGLGWMIGLFFVLVYLSVGGEADTDAPVRFLNGFQVFIATLFGLVVGSLIIFGLRFGMGHARGISLQVAIYTALNLTLLFLVFIAGPITQRMIGIFGLAIGIATLFAMVLFPTPQREQELNIRAQSGTQGGQPYNPNGGAGAGGGNPIGNSRLDEIRNRMNNERRQ
ncbi:MAG: hypothetical protein Phog2KO_20570 [Phototrophicaceae bacterium]